MRATAVTMESPSEVGNEPVRLQFRSALAGVGSGIAEAEAGSPLAVGALVESTGVGGAEAIGSAELEGEVEGVGDGLAFPTLPRGWARSTATATTTATEAAARPMSGQRGERAGAVPATGASAAGMRDS
jgi:hypothetical protein